MKLFFTSALFAAATAQESGTPFARTIEQIESEYVQVPEG